MNIQKSFAVVDTFKAYMPQLRHNTQLCNSVAILLMAESKRIDCLKIRHIIRVIHRMNV